jgi:hypothetical protein
MYRSIEDDAAVVVQQRGAEFTVKKAALRLVWITFSKMASSVEPVGVRPEMPALAKTMSSFPATALAQCGSAPRVILSRFSPSNCTEKSERKLACQTCQLRAP